MPSCLLGRTSTPGYCSPSFTRLWCVPRASCLVNTRARLAGKGWPLSIPLTMATGDEQSEDVVSSPFPIEAFGLTTREMQGGRHSKLDSLPMRGT